MNKELTLLNFGSTKRESQKRRCGGECTAVHSGHRAQWTACTAVHSGHCVYCRGIDKCYDFDVILTVHRR